MTRATPQHLITALTAKGATLPCARCGSQGFEVLGEGWQALAPPTRFPVVVVACRHCGYLVWHATRPLLET